MSQSAEQQKAQEEANQRFLAYQQQFKSPVLSGLASFSQDIPNIIDTLIKQVVLFEQQNQQLTAENKRLNDELTLAKTPKTAKQIAAPDAGKK